MVLLLADKCLIFNQDIANEVSANKELKFLLTNDEQLTCSLVLFLGSDQCQIAIMKVFSVACNHFSVVSGSKSSSAALQKRYISTNQPVRDLYLAARQVSKNKQAVLYVLLLYEPERLETEVL